MSLSIPLPVDASFDADAVRAMSLAFDRALRELHDKGQPDIVREVLANRIIRAASGGERDSERLCEIALGRRLNGLDGR
jgi:hypothetical protein